MSELTLNIIGVGLIYIVIFAILAVVIKIAIYFAKRGDNERT